ncbi:MAG: response regulator transcription factor [Acidobacteria bacterium]|nr:response regulator transcription factor [Acidobacteriota bacterium]
MKTLVFAVEDEEDIARLLRYHLEAGGHQVRVFHRSAGVLAEAEQSPPGLFLLDIMLPGGSGLDLCRQIRHSRQLSHVPVIFLTARGSEADRVTGLEIGGDDYITKPFSPRELIARVRAVLRRFERPLQPARISAGEIEIDSGAMSVVVRGAPVITTATEFRLLEYLARHAGQVFTRDQLLDAVWRDRQYVTERSVDVYIRKLREKVEREPESPVYLRTVRGAGYRFEVPKSARA